MTADSFVVNVEAAIYRGDRWLMIERAVEESHAAGTLSMVGGTAESSDPVDNILEAALRRELREEVDVFVGDNLRYVESKLFTSDTGCMVIDVVFLAEYSSGDPRAVNTAEVAGIYWLTLDEILTHPKTPPWIAQSMRIAETMRIQET